MANARHVTWAEVLDYLESDRPQGATARHLGRCPDCRELESEASRLISALAAAAIPEPDEAMIDRTWSRIAARRRASAPSRIRAGLREIRAVLAATGMSPALALRGAVVPRVLVYEAGPYAVSLSVEGAGGETRSLQGKVIPREAPRLPAGGRAILRQGRGAKPADLTEFGGFFFPDLAPGGFELLVEVGGMRIRLPSVS